MPDLTQDEINDIVKDARDLNPQFCRLLIHYMMGYLRMSDDINAAKQVFFYHIKQNIEKGGLP